LLLGVDLLKLHSIFWLPCWQRVCVAGCRKKL